MRPRILSLLFGLGSFLAFSLLTGSPARPVQAANTFRAPAFTTVRFNGSGGAGGVYPLDDLQTGDCAGLTVADLRAGGLKTLSCRLHCDPIGMSDGDLSICIDQYSGNPVENPPDPAPPDEQSVPPEEPPVPDSGEIQPENPPLTDPPGDQPENPSVPDPYDSQPDNPADGGFDPDAEIPDSDYTPPDEPSKSLGPLATSPLVPLAGGLIGTVVGWLVSVATTSGSLFKSNVPSILPTSPAPATPASRPISPPSDSGEPPPGPAENLWDIASNLTGSGSTVVSTLSEFFDFPDSAKTLEQVRDAVRAWHDNPTAKAAENYVKSLGKTVNVRLKNLSDNLGNISLAMDGIDAVRAGLKTAAERGYTGADQVLAVGAELSKKALNFALTKNPVVSLVNSALGGVTQMTLGDDGRLDIGTLIDKGADAWDATTQEYAGYTEGSYLPGNYTEELAKDAGIQSQDQYLHAIRRIKSLVEQGKITREEGCTRIRALRTTLGDK